MLREEETCIKSRHEAIVLCNTFIQLAGQNCCPFLHGSGVSVCGARGIPTTVR